MSRSYWQVVFYPYAEKEYEKLGKTEQKQFIRKIQHLASDSELKLAFPLSNVLAGYYKLEFAGRYRTIIYKVEENRILIICSIGIRKDTDRDDVYSAFKRWLKRYPKWFQEFMQD